MEEPVEPALETEIVDGDQPEVASSPPRSPKPRSSDASLAVSTSWSTTLASPQITAFSPSREEGRAESLHGYGLQAAFDRSTRVNRASRRVASLLQEVSGLYEQYAQSLVKAGQSLQPAIGTTPLPLLTVQGNLLAWSGEHSKLGETVRTTIAEPLQTFLDTYADTVSGIQQRYSQSRQKCAQSRHKAIGARTRYLKSLREAEPVYDEWKASNPIGKPPKRVASKIREVQHDLDRYKRYVDRENEYVRQSQRLEEMMLDTLETLDYDRLTLMIHSMTTTLKVSRKATLELAITASSDSREDVVTDKRRRFKFLGRNTDESSGVMDAETLGLPEDIGLLRDEVRSKLNGCTARVQAAKAVASFLDQVSAAAKQLGDGVLLLLMKEDGRGRKVQRQESFGEPITDTVRAVEGPASLKVWGLLETMLNDEGRALVSFADHLNKSRIDKLDRIIQYGDRSMKSSIETEAAMWKHLCDAVRVQSRAQDRYRANAEESAKARERVRSVDSQSELSPKRGVNKTVGKHIANMFSILPDGGEQAMKMLAPGARARLVQHSLEGAGEKEQKGRQVLDAATEAASRALDGYKSTATTLIARCDEEEQNGWTDLKVCLDSLLEGLGSQRRRRVDWFTDCSETFEVDVSVVARSDEENWRKEIQESLAARSSVENAAPESPVAGFRLPLVEESSTLVEALATRSGDSDEPLSMIDDDECGVNPDSVDGSRGDEVDDGTPGSTDNVSSDADHPSVEGSSTDTWLKRSASSILSGSSHKSGEIGRKLDIGAKIRKVKGEFLGLDTETDIFMSYLWPRSVELQLAPTLHTSFPCSFRDSRQQLPFQYGRVYLTSASIVFVSWTGKKLALKWPAVLSVEKVPRFVGTEEDTLVITCQKTPSEESRMVLGGFVDREVVLERILSTRSSARVAEVEENDRAASLVEGLRESVTASLVPPDQTLRKMSVVVSGKLRNMSVQRYHEVVWSEKQKAFYQPWLEKVCFDVELGQWQHGDFVGPWCNESYQQKRFVKFRVKRRTHLYIGPPIANVQQTHYCRIEGDDKCVVTMTIQFEGMPYADCFAVEVRWVARREDSDLAVECGVTVDFKKSTFLKSKISSGTIEETTPVQRNLFETMRLVCAAASGEALDDTDDETSKAVEVEKPKSSMFSDPVAVCGCGMLVILVLVWKLVASYAISQVPASSLDVGYGEVLSRMNRLENEVLEMRHTLNEILLLLKEANRE